MSWKTPWIARKCVILWPGVAVVVIVELRQDAIGMVVQLQVVFIIVYWELVLADCNTYSCSLDCANAVNSSWQQEIIDCGAAYG